MILFDSRHHTFNNWQSSSIERRGLSVVIYYLHKVKTCFEKLSFLGFKKSEVRILRSRDFFGGILSHVIILVFDLYNLTI